MDDARPLALKVSCRDFSEEDFESNLWLQMIKK